MPGAATRRLDPFALPAETTLRFVLLVVAAVGTALFAFNWLYFSLADTRNELARYRVCLEAEQIALGSSGDIGFANEALQRCLAPRDHRKGRVVAAGTAGVLLLGGAGYLAWPALKRRRRRLRPLRGDVPEVAERVAALAVEAGLRRTPEVLWNPLQRGGGALAFGLPWRPAIALGAGTVAARYRDPPAFDAVVRHELAHLRNGDVAKTYLAGAVWWALVAGAIAPLLVSLLDEDAATVGKVLWRLAALTALVYLTRNAIVRSREYYADLRAAQWDGPGGALRRVLEAMPPARHGRLRTAVGMHPDPAARRALLDAPAPLFRFSPLDAFTAGAAAGLAFPSVVGLLSLLTTATSAYGSVHAYAALLVAPFVAGVLVIAAWRATQAALAHGAGPPATWRPALALAAGLAVGQLLALDAIADPGGGVADIGGVAYWSAWALLLVGLVAGFARWLVLTGEAWLPGVRRSPRRALAAAIALGAVALAWGLGQLASVSTFIDSLRDTGLWRIVAPDAGALGGGLLDLIVQKNVTFAVLAAIWALPLAGWMLARGEHALAGWAFLDREPATAPAPPRPDLRPALAAAAPAAAAFLVLLLAWRLAVHATVDLAVRDTDSYILSFAHRLELFGVVLQAGVGAVVALRARHAAPFVGLMAAFAAGVLIVFVWLGVTRAAGCLDAVTIRPSGDCWAPMERSFMWTTLKDWVGEGQLLAFVAIPAALAGRQLGHALTRLAGPRRSRRPA
jgi:Zn-dependent protease with chaperone function